MELRRWLAVWAAPALVVVALMVANVEGKNSASQEALRQRAADRVAKLPGQPASVTFRQYAGYVDVGSDNRRHLFYYLAESPTNCSAKPLVLWLNGGPGCSSMGVGWAEEMGPYRILPNGSGLVLNSQSWIRYANVLFLDSPTGVGYSYSDDPQENFNGGDARTAEDSYSFLIKWLERFPEYQTRDFYITGESYAGHYIPQLATLIHERNRDASQKINLKGIMVGNPSIDTYYDGIGSIDYWLSHAMISPNTHEELHRACNFTDPNCCSQKCNNVYYYAQQVEVGGIDIYSIDMPACVVPNNGSPPNRRRLIQASRTKNPFKRVVAGYDPCYASGIKAQMYFNRKDVQKAFHANVSGEIPYKWVACSVDMNWIDQAYTVLPLYEDLMEAGYRVWLYSGDNDGVVPITGTIYAIDSLNLPVTIPWYAWYTDAQVAGRAQYYKGLTLVTFRGAGHEVPLLQPGRFLHLLKGFLGGEELPWDPIY